MAELESDTHGMALAGALGTAAGDTNLGTVTLPAGGPWTIFGVWCQVVQATMAAGDGVFGHFRLNAAQGDLEPNPAPSRFPFTPQPSFLGATGDVQPSPLKIFPVEYTAPGKASVEFIVNQAVANAVAPQAVMGIIFGKTIPEDNRILFIDRVRAQVTAAVDTAVGIITIAEKATEITHVFGVLGQDNVLTAGEELLGFFRLASDDLKMPPAQYPFQCAFSAGLGALVENVNGGVPILIPVKMPVEGGARIDCFVDLNTAVTAAAEVLIGVCYK